MKCMVCREPFSEQRPMCWSVPASGGMHLMCGEFVAEVQERHRRELREALEFYDVVLDGLKRIE